ncbi:hypothetical protein ACNKHV_25090 [Shigella flexneri]
MNHGLGSVHRCSNIVSNSRRITFIRQRCYCWKPRRTHPRYAELAETMAGRTDAQRREELLTIRLSPAQRAT